MCYEPKSKERHPRIRNADCDPGRGQLVRRDCIGLSQQWENSLLLGLKQVVHEQNGQQEEECKL
jgi:hypothetical protein